VILADDDVIEASNLHRQILYTDGDVGSPKLEAAARALAAIGGPSRVEPRPTRLLPETASALVRSADVVIEGADNFATKFLAADACHLEGRPVVHGSAIRWRATVWAVAPDGAPCYRCLFEDLPPAAAGETCAEAGVVGPVVGLAGALMADLALRILAGDGSAYGQIHTIDGLGDRLRRVPVAARPGCALCGSAPSISDLAESRYVAPPCAA
jgi:adenylyltransferase/sulfurtransferase